MPPHRVKVIRHPSLVTQLHEVLELYDDAISFWKPALT